MRGTARSDADQRRKKRSRSQDAKSGQHSTYNVQIVAAIGARVFAAVPSQAFAQDLREQNIETGTCAGLAPAQDLREQKLEPAQKLSQNFIC